MYTHDAPTAQTPVAGDTAHTLALANAIYPDQAPKPVDFAPNMQVRAVRDARPATALYSDLSNLGPRGVAELARATNPLGSVEEIDEQSASLAACLADIGASRQDLDLIAGFVRASAANPPTASERAAHQRAAVQQLTEEYGPAAAGEALADARRLAQRDPRFAAYLNRTALADHPWVVSFLARQARNQKTRGLLK